MDRVEEMTEMFEWLANDLDKIPISDQLKLALAVSELCDKIRPIYVKSKLKEEGATFLFKM